MNKKGFTLVELLAVVVIIGIITGIATGSFNKIINGIHEKMLETKIKTIEEAAIIYGQDNLNNIDNISPVTVQTLIDKNYLSSKEKCKYNDGSTYNCFINNVTDESMNNMQVLIYQKNNQVESYAIQNDNAYIKAYAGDVNYDGKITSTENVGDNNLILSYSVGKLHFSDAQSIVADTTNDGSIDSSDALRVMQFVQGYITINDLGYKIIPINTQGATDYIINNQTLNDQGLYKIINP
jgi:prepilin-type N-terminal cleavage/methylation domain-containing protein